ncbi:5-formyltetrahydrofolate cyclo-ligase [Nakamurella sp. GG22]
MQPADPPIGAQKDRLRAALIESRRSRGEAERRRARAANAEHLLVAVQGLSCVACYLPLPTEPLARELLDRLAETCRVLVPVTLGPLPLDWCEYPGPVSPGSFGILEPTGERLGSGAITDADAVLVPALAVDRAGHRLGRGGGHYDRTLALRHRLRSERNPRGTVPADRTALIAVLFDGEFVDTLPHDAFDQPVTAVVTPGEGVRLLR